MPNVHAGAASLADDFVTDDFVTDDLVTDDFVTDDLVTDATSDLRGADSHEVARGPRGTAGAVTGPLGATGVLASEPAARRPAITGLRPGERRRTGAPVLAVALHAALALTAVARREPPPAPVSAETAVLVDVAPLAPPAAAPEPPVEPPPPERVQPEAPTPQPIQKPVRQARPEAPRTPVVAEAAVAVPAAPQEPPREAVETPAGEAVAPPVPVAPPGPRASSGLPTGQGLVLGRLNQFKRYPREAQTRRHQGVPYVRFTMDRTGRVLSSKLEKSSGYPALDREATELVRRAQPLPPPPDDVPGPVVELVVPVEFFLR